VARKVQKQFLYESVIHVTRNSRNLRNTYERNTVKTPKITLPLVGSIHKNTQKKYLHTEQHLTRAGTYAIANISEFGNI
jgi:hypothetical protein